MMILFVFLYVCGFFLFVAMFVLACRSGLLEGHYFSKMICMLCEKFKVTSDLAGLKENDRWI